ncbi:MAG TPA: DUF998 domain-containing protein [Phenylobacterium sp.]
MGASLNGQRSSRAVAPPNAPPAWLGGETPNARTARLAGTLAAASFTYVVLVVAALPFLRPEYDASVNWISDYAVGRLGWLQTSAFTGTSLGVAALVIGLIRMGPATWIARTGLVFLSVLVPGLVVAALFQTDLPHHPMTRHGLIHNLDALANFLCGLIGALFLAAGFGDDPRWRPFRGTALILAVFSVVALVNQFLTDALRLPWSGVSNRVFAGSLVTWLLLTALHLRRVAAATTSAVST